MNTRNLIRWAGISAMLAGIFYVAVGLFHPPNVVSSVTTPQWAIVHILAMAMCFFGLLGITGIYARQAKESGWLGLAGYILLSLWLVVIAGFTFVEVLILPMLATATPAFVEGWLGMFNGSAGTMDLGALPMVWTLSGPLYMLSGLLFGIATLRAGILSRIPAGLLAVGTMLAPVAALLPLEIQPKTAIPVGLALAWLGYALWSERRTNAAEEQAAQPIPGKVSPASPQLSQTAVR
ncbi:MAG: hypothetical protein IVW55_02125 [Chloroflexi bacterium]|nr:hypothetical protein [Chloroflexota bacterium]